MFPLPNVSTGTSTNAAASATSSSGLTFPGYTSGQRFLSVLPGFQQATAAAIVPAIGRFRLAPLYVEADVTVDRVGIFTNTGAGGNIRVAIYNSSRALIVDCGIAVHPGSSALVDKTIAATLLRKGVYYAYFNADAGSLSGSLMNYAAPTTSTSGVASALPLAHIFDTSINPAGLNGWYMSGVQAYGAAPAVLPATDQVDAVTTTFPPLSLRVA